MTRIYLYSIRRQFILLVVILFNFWIWNIIQKNLAVAIMLILLTFLLFLLIMERKLKIWVLTIVFILFFLLFFIIIKSDFDKGIQHFTPEDQVRLNERHLYYAQELGAIFLNRKILNYYKNYSLQVYKLEGNLFSNLDLNLYFFASHPRERAGVSEFEKFPPLLLPFFIIGTLLLIYWGSIRAAIYLVAATFVGSFITQNYILGPILFFPLISVCIAIGIIYISDLITGFKI